jgi:hypothetical protein
MDWYRTFWIRAAARAKGRVAVERPLLCRAGIVLFLLMLLLSNTAIAESADRGVVHTVYLWLKNPGNQQQRNQLLTATDRLSAIPGVLEIRYGEVIESDRAIVDDSFDVGIYFYFSDEAAMNSYLVHPLHKKVVEQDIRPVVERIVVHDFTDTLIR